MLVPVYAAPSRRYPNGNHRRLALLLILIWLVAIAAPLLPPRAISPAPAETAPSRPPMTLDATPPPPAAILPADLVGKPEIAALRTLDSSTYDLGGGRYALMSNSAPLHYRAADGSWQPINPAFETVKTGWINRANTVQTGLAPTQSQASISAGAVGARWQPLALDAVADGHATTLATPLPAEQARLGRRLADGALVRYPASWSDPALQDQWQAFAGGSEYSLRLADAPRAPGGAGTPDSLDLRVRLELLPGTTIQVDGKRAALPLTTDAAISLVAADGSALDLAAPFAYEQRAIAQRSPARYRLSAGARPTEVELRVSVPWNWLADPARQYPVIIDPVFQMRQGVPMRSPGYWPDLNGFIGYFGAGLGPFQDDGGQRFHQRVLVKFAMPSMPPNTVVEEARIVATPTGAGTGKHDWGWMNVQARALDSSAWIGLPGSQGPSASQMAGAVIGPTWQKIGYSGGEPDKPTSASWDVTALVSQWLNPLNPNHGIVIQSDNEFCAKPNPDHCAAIEFDGDRTWSVEDLAQIEPNPAAPYASPKNNGGIRLVVRYRGPTLNASPDNVANVVEAVPPATGDEAYFHPDHDYQIPPAAPNTWRALVARGRAASVDLPGPVPPEPPPAPITEWPKPTSRSVAGSLAMKLRNAADDAELASSSAADLKINAIVLRDTVGAARLRVQSSGAMPPAYDMRLVNQTGSLNAGLQTAGDPPAVAVEHVHDSRDPLAFWAINLPAASNSRVDVEVYADEFNYNGGSIAPGPPADGGFYDNARYFRARMWQAGDILTPDGAGVMKIENDAPAGLIAHNTPVHLSQGPFKPAGGAYVLALAYEGPQIQGYTCNLVGGGEFTNCDNQRVPLRFKLRLRVTSCGPDLLGNPTFPTAKGTCQIVRCPTLAVAGDPAKYREASFGLWSEGGWAADGAGQVSQSAEVAPLIGGTGAAVPTVVVLGGVVKYAGGLVQVARYAPADAPPDLLLVNCGSLAAPNNPLTGENYFTTFKNEMQRDGARLVPLSSGGDSVFYHVWPQVADIVNRQLSIDPAAGALRVAGTLQLSAGNRAETGNLSFDLEWALNYQGWPSLQGAVLANSGAPPTVASLILALNGGYALDLGPRPLPAGKDQTRGFNALRVADATISQPTLLGGATKPIKALILPRDTAPSGSNTNEKCYNAGGAPISCIDLRAPEDTPDQPQRVWAMPDIHTEFPAGMVMLRKEGEVQVYSADHPAARPDEISQSFSYDAFNASVSVKQERCDSNDAGGPIVTVIRGETRMVLPNLGDGGDPDSVIAASFKICQTSLRSVHMEFKSSYGIPIGNSGLFLTGLSGGVDIYNDHTTINFGVDFQASQGGDGGLFKAHGDVTIDTRGLFAFQGNAKILSVIDAKGTVWAAWNPLDIGFESEISYGDWLSGTARGHLWAGQGWQHRYPWLPDNDERHIAASIGATIKIEQGAVFESFVLDLPPSDIRLGFEVAFGQFCTNASCTGYEWGVKGTLEILGYDVGLYYGFDHGFDFILGNDGHVLIDQYGGGSTSPILLRGKPMAAQRGAPIIAGTASEPFTVTAQTEQVLVALGWKAGAPDLALRTPGGLDLSIPANQVRYSLQISNTGQQTLISLQRPADGADWTGVWSAAIGNLGNEPFVEDYELVALMNKGAPGTPGDYRLTAPAAAEEPPAASGIYTIRWNVPPGLSAAPSSTISLFATRVPTTTGVLGYYEPIHLNLPLAAGAYDWDTRGLPSGVYQIDAEVSDGDNALPDDPNAIARADDTCAPLDTWLPPARSFAPGRFPGLVRFSSPGKVRINDTVAPAAPTGLALTPSDSALLARWNGPGVSRDIAGYALGWRRAGDPAAPKTQRLTAVAAPTLRIGGLDNGAAYQVTVQAFDSSGNTGPMIMLNATPGGASDPVPFRPLNPAATHGPGASALIDWEHNSEGPNAASYRVIATRVMTRTIVNTPTLQTVDVPAPATAASIANLQIGAVYDFRVSAANAAGWRSAATSETLRLLITNGLDANGDSIADDWATVYGGGAALGAAADPDGDGLSNLEEYGALTNPIMQDSDGDGFSDLEERDGATDALDSRRYPDHTSQPRLELARHRASFRINKDIVAFQRKYIEWNNPSGGHLALQVATSSPWLKAAVLTWPGNDQAGEIGVGFDPKDLAPGFYSGVVRVTAGAASDPLIGGGQCILVNVWVRPAVGGNKAYLPLIGIPERQAELVGSITLTPNKTVWAAGEPVQITAIITNTGSAPTTPFWADLYINPAAPPTTANQPWYERCGLDPCFGMAWRVTEPLAPGESITLTSTAGSYSPGHTIWPGWFASGTSDLYLYVDSWNPGDPGGIIDEPNEANNRFGLHGLSVSGPNPPTGGLPTMDRIDRQR